MAGNIPQTEETPTAEEVTRLALSWLTLSMSLSRGRSQARQLRQINELGLTFPMIITLNVIAFEGRQTMTTLLDHLSLSTSATSHLIQRLVELGLVERRDNPDDRRQKIIALTNRGTAFVGEMMAGRFAEMRESIAPLSSSTKQALFDVMGTVVSELSQHLHERRMTASSPAASTSSLDDIAAEIADAAAEAGDAIADAGDVIADSAARVGDVIADSAARMGDAIADKVEHAISAGMQRVVERVTGRPTSPRPPKPPRNTKDQT
ncbi:MAG TPA: MarR family transcriptional regulator [Myxococcota bacterium]